MRHKHRKRQTVIHYILSYILMISIVVATVTIIGKYAFSSERAILHAGEKSHYYFSLKNEIEQTAIDYAIPYGIDKTCIKGAFQISEVKSDVLKTTHEKVVGEKEIIDFGNIEKRIRTGVENKEGKLNVAQTKSLDSYIDKVKKMYFKKLHFPTEDFMVMSIKYSTKIAWIAIPLSMLIGLFCMVYLIASRHYAYHGIRRVVYGVMGAGALISIGFAAIISNGSIYDYNITDSYMKGFYVYWIGHALLMCVIAGIAILLIGLIGIFLAYRQKYAIRN